MPGTRTNPYRGDLDWRFVIIGGTTVPGIVRAIDGADKPEKWLVQMGITVSNAVSLWRGRQLAESITIRTELPNEDTIDQYWDLRDKLRPKSGARPPSFAIVNATINFAGITRVSTITVRPPIWREAANSWFGEIVLIEYNPPKVAPIGPADPPKAKTENDVLADEVQRLVGVAKEVSQ